MLTLLMKGNFSGPFSPTTRIVFFFFSSSFSTPKKNESSETDPWQLPSGQSQTPAPPRFLTGQENELLDDVVVDCDFFCDIHYFHPGVEWRRSDR